MPDFVKSLWDVEVDTTTFFSSAEWLFDFLDDKEQVIRSPSSVSEPGLLSNNKLVIGL